MRLAWGLGAALFVWPALASAQAVLGYQLGVSQSASGNYGDSAVITTAAPVQQLQGVNLNTAVSANVTYDIVGDALSHAFVLGATATQLIPAALPEDAQGGALDQQLTTFAASAAYQLRYTRPRYSVGFGAGYSFNLNGRLETAADGSVQGNVGGGGAGLPADRVGAFAFSGRTHSINAVTTYTLTRTNWDLGFGVSYSYTQNGIFSTAAGGLGGQAQGAATVGTNLGQFVAANIHSVSPQITYRANVGRRGTFSANVGASYTLPEEAQDSITVTGTVTQIVPAPPSFPQTLVNNGTLQYSQNFGESRQVGGALTGTLSYRLPTDATGQPLPGSGLAPDTIIVVLRAIYADRLPGELRLDAGLGLAQARMLQPPLGAAVSADDFDGINSDLLPVADLRLARLFDPIDLSLSVARGVSIGALGASAIVSDSASLSLSYTLELGERRLVAQAGANVQRSVGVGAEDFQFTNPGGAIAAAFNNQGYGAAVGIGMPIYASTSFNVIADARYGYNFVDSDPDNERGVPALAQHTFSVGIQGTYGRGAANAGAGAGGGGGSDTAELDAFTANPRDGSILTSARLMQQGARMIELPGQRPGDQPTERRDSRQAYQQSLRQEKIDQEARDRSEAVQSTGSSQQEEERAQERERKAQEERAEQRSRSFGDVSFESVPLPTETPPPPPPPPPPAPVPAPPPK